MMLPSDPIQQRNETYYNEHAEQFCAQTLPLDLGALYAPFLALLPPGATILDAGCGSGRDSLFFQQQGYQVTAMDAAAKMVELAAQQLGQPVLHLSFQALEAQAAFDGIWACASLLHVPRVQMDDVMARLARALKGGGVLFASFKYGDAEQTRDGRYFNGYDEAAFATLIAAQPELELVRLWQTDDVRAGRGGERWLNVLLKRVHRQDPDD
jgi:2-polyprenyl-3-methyl-5-hydroxy-6-metoxy-1,4-benzoquinol methylase